MDGSRRFCSFARLIIKDGEDSLAVHCALAGGDEHNDGAACERDDHGLCWVVSCEIHIQFAFISRGLTSLASYDRSAHCSVISNYNWTR